MSYTPSPRGTRRLPAEWAPQSGVMLTWPRPECDWGARLPAVETVFAALAAEISRRQVLIVSCLDEAHRHHVRGLIEGARAEMDAVSLYVAPSNDVWVRDHGPITVTSKDGSPLLLDFTFNGWGGKYPADLDNRLTRGLHAQAAFGDTPIETCDFVLEGGSIDSDGAGTLLTTRACLLSPGRNAGWSQEDIERYLGQALGVTRTLWLRNGWLAGDDTDSHVDNLARFCSERTIAHATCEDPADEHYEGLADMAAELASLRDAQGRPYGLVPLPLPLAKRDGNGARLPASYANFLIINGAVLVPVYDDPADRIALDRLRAAFPDRDVIAIPALPLIGQYGSLHCATMQLPRGVAVA